MANLHPDSRVIDHIGMRAVRAHFGMTRQGVAYWRTAGVPNEHRRAMIALGRKAGADVTEMKNTGGRKRGRPATTGPAPASSTPSA